MISLLTNNQYEREDMRYKIMVLSTMLTVCLTGFACANEHFNVDDKINRMKADLNLTDDQVRAVKPIFEDYKNTMELAEKEKKGRLASVLNDDQMKKMEQAKKEHEKMEHND